MVIKEQTRRYNEKMEEIEQLEYAETLAVNQLKLKRQNTVRDAASTWAEFSLNSHVFSFPAKNTRKKTLLWSFLPFILRRVLVHSFQTKRSGCKSFKR